MTDLIGKTVGRYQIVSTVGWGGMARVYKAYQASLDRYVALKVLHEHLAEDPNFVERFEQEATAVARLRHPNIVQVFDYDNQGDLYYIVMEFVEGPTLKAEIHERLKHHNNNERQIFDLDEIVRLIAYLSDAIDYAHSRGMVHRDVKPGNIMFTLEGQVMLTDFGLARMVFASEQRRASALSGTPAYMAPEQVEGSLVDERSDIYSLGVILYELFTGQVPFRADAPHTIMTMHVTDEVPSVRQLNPDVTMDTETVILKALSKDPGKRYQTAIEFSGALQETTGVIVVHSSTGGLVSPIATMADSQEMMPVSTQAGISELTLSAISSPYRGLYAFREEDAPYFFGREAFANKLTETVRERSMAAVIGPSGSGKSSVVFAGLLPKLRKSDNWTIIQMRPGSEPFYSLAGVLTDMLEPEYDETRRSIESRQLATLLRGGQLNLSELFRRIAQLGNDHSRQLLVIDQFEELYTLCTDDKIRHLFPNSLFEAVDASRGQADFHLSLVLTLRADFMGQALTDRPFADALQDADVKLGPMTRAELGRAIESPAAKKRVVFEAGLVERILDDVGEEPGNLPLLEFALTLLWDRRSGRRLTHSAYESIGRVEGSLARYADEIYDQLGPLERERARRVFTQMVRPGEGTEDTRRLATREELGEQDWSLAQRLADARLVTTGRSPAGEETVEIVHEALIHGWGRVRQWMNSERAFRSWQERMRIAMVQWETSERDEGALLHGAPLAEAEEWLGQKIADLSESEATYIRTSIALREKEVAEREAQRQRELAAARQLAKEQQRRAVIEHRRAEEQTRSTHRLRLSAIILAVVFLLAVVAAIVAYGQSRDAARQADARATEVLVRSTAESSAMDNARLAATRASESASARVTAEAERFRADESAKQALEAKDVAETERDRADRQSSLALSRQLAAESATLLGPQLDLALLLSLEANNISDSAETASSLLVALQANPSLVTFLRGHPSLLQSVAFSPDGKLLATAGAEGLVLLWDVENGEMIKEYAGHDPTQLVNRVVFSPDGRTLATASDDTAVILWDAETGEIRRRLDGHSAWAQSVNFSPDGAHLLSGSGDRTAIIWDVESGRAVNTLTGHGGAIWDAVYSNDGTLIATGSADGTVIIWDAATGQPLQTLSGHNAAVFNVDFNPSDEILASGGGDFNLILWDVKSGEPIGTPLVGHAAGVIDVAFSPDGQTIASSSGDSTVRLWDTMTQEQIQLFANHSGLVPSVDFSPDGLSLASGDAAGTAILWDITPGIQAMGSVITGHVGAVNNLDFSPSGETLATTGADSTVRFWDAVNGVQASEPITHGQRITEPISALTFAADGRVLASGSQNGTVLFWDLDSMEPYSTTISALTNGITSLALDLDDRLLVTGGTNGFTALWDIDTGTQIGPFLSGHADSVNAVAISSDGQVIASGGADGTVIIRPITEIQVGQAAGTPISPLTYEQAASISILSLDFNPEGSRLVTGDNQGQIAIWDVQERQLITQISLSDGGAVLKVHFSPQGDVLAAGNARGEIKILNVETGDPIERSMKLPDGGVSDLAFSGDGSRLTAISEAGTIRSWDAADGSLISEMQVALDPERTFVAISPEAGVVGSGFRDGEIQLISLESGRELGPSIIHATPFLGNVTTVAYSPDGTIVATAGADGAIVLWDAESLQPIDDPMFGHNVIVVSLAFSPDGRTLASGSCGEFNLSGNCIGGEVLLWDVVSGQQLHRFTDSVGFVQALAFSPDGKMLVTNDCSRVEVAGACIEGTLRLWDVNSGRIIERDFEGHTGFIWSATFSPDGKILASGSNDNSVILWDVATGEQIGQRLSNHGGPVRRVAFSPDGTRLASAGFDNLVFLWNVESGQAIGGPVAFYTNNAMDVAFNSEGTVLASSSADGTVILTDVDLESWRVLACRIANRNMRQAEWELFFGEVPFQETCPSD